MSPFLIVAIGIFVVLFCIIGLRLHVIISLLLAALVTASYVLKASFSNMPASLEDGLLSFPVTDFDNEGKFNPKTYAVRLDWFVTHNVSSVFVAGGTGEFFSLLQK